MTKKEISKVLRQARDLMNDNGAHWIRRNLTRKLKDGERGYCSAGAIFQVMGVKGSNSYCPKKAAPAIVALANEIEKGKLWPQTYTLDSADAALRAVITFNDSTGAWSRVRNLFTEAAK